MSLQEDEQEDGRLPPYWVSIRSADHVVIEIRHVDSRGAKNIVAVAEMDPVTPFRWALVRFEVVDPKFDKGPHSTPWIGLWQSVCHTLTANGIEELTQHTWDPTVIAIITLDAFNDQDDESDDTCRMGDYARRLYNEHPHAHALHFRGIGLEGLIVPPTTYKLPTRKQNT